MDARAPAAQAPLLCSHCHQPLLPTYYFCPNCGAKINNAPLSTSVGAQARLYVFSAILPALCYLFISKWQGIKYFRSSDPKTKNIGSIAILILAAATIVTVWLAYIWTQEIIQQQIAAINADMSAQGP